MENCKYFNNCGSVENCKNCKGSDYYYRAKSHFDNIYGANNYKLVDLGSNYHKKIDVKRGNF